MVKMDQVWRLRLEDDGTMSILIYQVIAFNLVEDNARDS
jgi:hypothetical protein